MHRFDFFYETLITKRRRGMFDLEKVENKLAGQSRTAEA